MSDQHDDDATVLALLERLRNFRLPRLLAIKKQVDGGARLSDSEFEFLKRTIEDAQDGQKFVVRNPEFHALAAQLVQLYDDIVRKATSNEGNP